MNRGRNNKSEAPAVAPAGKHEVFRFFSAVHRTARPPVTVAMNRTHKFTA